MQYGNWLLDLLFAQVNIGLIPVIVLLTSLAVLAIFIVYLLRFAGIGTALFYVAKGNTLKIFKADETERTVSAGKKLTFSKVSEGKHAAAPVMYIRRFRPRRAFLAVEGHPTIVDWRFILKKDYNLPKFTAEDLSNIVDGTIAKGLAKALIQAVKSDWVKIFMGFLIGFFFMGLIYPFIVP